MHPCYGAYDHAVLRFSTIMTILTSGTCRDTLLCDTILIALTTSQLTLPPGPVTIPLTTRGLLLNFHVTDHNPSTPHRERSISFPWYANTCVKRTHSLTVSFYSSTHVKYLPALPCLLSALIYSKPSLNPPLCTLPPAQRVLLRVLKV